MNVKQWMVAVSRGDYQSAAKMLIDDPKLARWEYLHVESYGH